MTATDRDVWLDHALAWRGVQDPCVVCAGSGVYLYPSTSTWRGGLGGCAMTHGVCDHCWGTGDEYRTGVDLRAEEGRRSAEVAERAANLLARRLGANMTSTRKALSELALEVDRLAHGRKNGPDWFRELARSLARTLGEFAEAKAPEERCGTSVSPVGWCSREKGHEGPCAVHAEPLPTSMLASTRARRAAP